MLNAKSVFFILVVFVLSQLSLAQSDSLRYEATQRINQNDSRAAVEIYLLLFATGDATGNDYYNAAFSWSILNDQEKALQYLDSAFLNGFTNLNHVQTDPDLKAIRNTIKFKELIKREIDFYKAERIDYRWIINALTQRSVVRLNNKIHFNSMKSWLSWDPLDVMEVVKSFPDLDLKLNQDSLIDFSNKRLIIQNGIGQIHIENLKLKSLAISNGQRLAEQVEARGYNGDNIVQLNKVQAKQFDWALSGYQSVRFFNVKSSSSNQYGASNIGNFLIDSSDLTLTEQFFEPLLSTAIFKFGYPEAPLGALNIQRSTLRSDSLMVGRIPLWVYASALNINGSIFRNEVDFHSSDVGLISMSKNHFLRAVNINNTNFHSSGNYMPLSQFEEGFGVEGDGSRSWDLWKKKTLVTGVGDEINQSEPYDKLVYNYKQMHTNYKDRGDIASANAAYVLLKDLTLARDLQTYRADRTFENWVQYRIGILMKLYTRSGTSPAKAIVISFVIILLFSFVYVFYPSEWDVVSKKKMLRDYGEFIEKNEKGYLLPFLKLLLGLFLSWLNAFALSLNAFVTLGFGAIPTKGLARYLCIIQGFMGWFLLSIFTVALINQVLI